MLFNSIEFFVFIIIFLVTYWGFIPRKKNFLKNLFICISSYIFYGWWSPKFLILIMTSTLLDYTIGLSLSKYEDEKLRKFLLFTSICINLGLLFIFKYYNFFIGELLNSLNLNQDLKSKFLFSIVLPVGISFYTFQTLSYTIDVYKKHISAEKKLVTFAAFVAFFPQLVAGPIERAGKLLPQLNAEIQFDRKKFSTGLKLIIYGLFKKIVIADSIAPYVNNIFSNYNAFESYTLWLGAIYFSIQIYCDFSGYSDIAIGSAKLLGINLSPNFKFPYFSTSISEFWRRWHISLSSFFKDYVYIPLGGSRKSTLRSLFNISLVFLISGIWHGANWTYIVWGIFHGLLFIPEFIFRAKNKSTKISYTLIQIISLNFFIIIGWVIFRSATLTDALNYILGMFHSLSIGFKGVGGIHYVLIFLLIDYLNRKDEINVLNFNLLNKPITNVFIALMCYSILLHFGLSTEDFIYFQF